MVAPASHWNLHCCPTLIQRKDENSVRKNNEYIWLIVPARKIVMNYLKTWFIIDLVVVG